MVIAGVVMRIPPPVIELPVHLCQNLVMKTSKESFVFMEFSKLFRNGSLHLTNIYWFGRKIPIQQANQCGQHSWVQHAYQPEQFKFGRSSTRQRFAQRHRFRQVSLVDEELQRRATELFVPYHRSVRRTQGQRSDHKDTAKEHSNRDSQQLTYFGTITDHQWSIPQASRRRYPLGTRYGSRRQKPVKEVHSNQDRLKNIDEPVEDHTWRKTCFYGRNKEFFEIETSERNS